MVENGVPHGDGLRRTHTGRWKTLRLAVILGFRHETDKKMEKNHRALDAGRWWCYNREGCESGSVPGSTHMGNPALNTEERTPDENSTDLCRDDRIFCR